MIVFLCSPRVSSLVTLKFLKTRLQSVNILFYQSYPSRFGGWIEVHEPYGGLGYPGWDYPSGYGYPGGMGYPAGLGYPSGFGSPGGFGYGAGTFQYPQLNCQPNYPQLSSTPFLYPQSSYPQPYPQPYSHLCYRNFDSHCLTGHFHYHRWAHGPFSPTYYPTSDRFPHSAYFP